MVQLPLSQSCIAHILCVQLSLLLFVVLCILFQDCFVFPDFLLLFMQVVACLLFIVFLLQLKVVLQSHDVSLASVALLFFYEDFIVKLNLGSIIAYALLAEREHSDYTASAGGEKQGILKIELQTCYGAVVRLYCLQSMQEGTVCVVCEHLDTSRVIICCSCKNVAALGPHYNLTVQTVLVLAHAGFAEAVF